MGLLEKLKNRARAYPQHIVLPEGEDRRAIAGAARVAREGYAKLTLLGRTKLIQTTAAELGAKLDGISVLDPVASPRLEEYAQIYLERRRARGISFEEVAEIASPTHCFASRMDVAGDTDDSD